MIEGAIMGLARNLALEKFPGIHKNDPVKTLSNSGEGAQIDLACSQIDEYLKSHPRTDGNRCRDPQWSTGLSSQSLVEEWEE